MGTLKPLYSNTVIGILADNVDVVTGSTNGKNWSTFGGNSVPDTDSRSLYHFPRHFGTGHFRKFISISHAVTGHFSQNLMK